MADFEIIRTEAESKRYLEQLSQAVDAHSDSFGFVPPSRFVASLRAGGLWILISGKEYAGHVMFGGALPTLKIEQLFVLPVHRKHGLGSKLIDEVVTHAELEGYSSIRARVATDLPANAFWERQGFHTYRTVAGGVTTGRVINVRIRRIQPRGAQMHMLAVFDGVAARPLGSRSISTFCSTSYTSGSHTTKLPEVSWLWRRAEVSVSGSRPRRSRKLEGAPMAARSTLCSS